MPSLFDILGRSTRETTTAAPQDSTAQAERIAATGVSGKATAQAGAGARTSTLGERAALQAAQTQLDTIQQQADITRASQAQQAKQITAEANIADKQLDNAALEQRQKYAQQTNEIIQELEQGRVQLDVNKGNAKLEQLGTALRLADDKYIYNLQIEGAKERLDNELIFKTQLNADVWDMTFETLRQDMEFQKLLNMDQQQFVLESSKWSVDDAIKYMNSILSAQSAAAPYVVGAAVASGAAGAYTTYNSDAAKKARKATGTTTTTTTIPTTSGLGVDVPASTSADAYRSSGILKD